jgi:uncharacterized membrane protein YgcG
VADAVAEVVVWLLAALLLLIAVAAAGIAIRRILLQRGGGGVECSLRRGQDQPWRLGLAAYTPDELRWFSAFGVLLRPEAVFTRSTMAIVARRPATADEEPSLGSRAVVIECRVGRETSASGRPRGDSNRGDSNRGGSNRGGSNRGGSGRDGSGRVELAMGQAALTGFLAWLEASPPGSPPASTIGLS